MRANALVCVLQANEYNYAKSLWDDEKIWKKTWITKNVRNWAFFYPLRSQQTKARLKQKRKKIQTNAECKKIVNRKRQGKAKNQVKCKIQGK
jgi:hypothetical protein